VFFSLQKKFSWYETQQLIFGTGTAIWWVTESHYTKIEITELYIKDKQFGDKTISNGHSQIVFYGNCTTIINTALVDTIEIGLEHTPFVVLVYFFPNLNMQKAADYGPQQH
jgi:hypothetical protein